MFLKILQDFAHSLILKPIPHLKVIVTEAPCFQEATSAFIVTTAIVNDHKHSGLTQHSDLQPL